MFTGLVEAKGRLAARQATDGAAIVTIEAPFAGQLAEGDSVAVSGVCLTVIDHTDQVFRADVMPETLQMTTLGDVPEGGSVNLERALEAGARLGGHVVQGHVNGVGTIVERRPGPRWDEVTIEVPADLAPYIAYKGSVTVDGVSLTVSGVTDSTFQVSLIPATLADTTLGERAEGDRVNIETDVLARYVERLAQMGRVEKEALA
ncbi:MAG: riboflavin synthase [Actinomycetaceae bacterium]|nr:riboflavin synthase [Actinomycetaceae bacterium]MDU0970968.1 riboflavin synthase [Actinomycetaceae bacterium]